jgi:drug/metabolite transporter (DMT)-like permease
MLWLGERAGIVRWAVLLVGFLGVVVVANPGMNTLALGAAFALLNAIMVGTVTAAVRGMTGTEKTETLLIWQLAMISALHFPLLVFGFHWATPRDFGLFFLSGISNLVAQYCWTKSLVLAPTTAVSPFFYFMLLWVTAIAYLVWGEVPTIHLVIGSCIVVAAGLYLLWHETKRQRTTSAA